PIPYHTSILTGEGWMLELLNSHPDKIWTCLGISHGLFDHLMQVLTHYGFGKPVLHTSHNGTSVEEQLGVFLY
ncbi:hypothetical protein BKA82DRAFT_52540, partial [Pisolithus tinctorius]